MNKVINVNQAIEIVQEIRIQNKKIVLVGGCFDILHPGHIYFLKKSKELGDLLFVLLESDENIKRRKGTGRPINSQNNRSIVLSSQSFVDYVIPLEGVTKDQDYDKLIVQIKPNVIVITKGDKNLSQRKRQCEIFGVRLELIEKLEGFSTSGLIEGRI